MEIRDLIRESYETAKEKGWEDPPRQRKDVPELLMLIVTEVAEGMEEYRNGKPDLYYDSSNYDRGRGTFIIFDTVDPERKPEGLAAELADVIIRICNMAGSLDLPLEKALAAKLSYNKTRPYRHGGKVC